MLPQNYFAPSDGATLQTPNFQICGSASLRRQILIEIDFRHVVRQDFSKRNIEFSWTMLIFANGETTLHTWSELCAKSRSQPHKVLHCFSTLKHKTNRAVDYHYVSNTMFYDREIELRRYMDSPQKSWLFIYTKTPPKRRRSDHTERNSTILCKKMLALRIDVPVLQNSPWTQKIKLPTIESHVSWYNWFWLLGKLWSWMQRADCHFFERIRSSAQGVVCRSNVLVKWFIRGEYLVQNKRARGHAVGYVFKFSQLFLHALNSAGRHWTALRCVELNRSSIFLQVYVVNRCLVAQLICSKKNVATSWTKETQPSGWKAKQIVFIHLEFPSRIPWHRATYRLCPK
jgi:hypothetical protein